MMKLMKVSMSRKRCNQRRRGLLVSVVVMLWRQLRSYTNSQTLWCCRQLPRDSCEVGWDGLWGSHSHGCLAIQGSVGVWRLRSCSHQLGWASRSQKRASGMMTRRYHGSIVMLRTKASPIHLVLMMERWVRTKEGVNIAVVEARNVAITTPGGSTNLVRWGLNMATTEMVCVMGLCWGCTHHGRCATGMGMDMDGLLLLLVLWLVLLMLLMLMLLMLMLLLVLLLLLKLVVSSSTVHT